MRNPVEGPLHMDFLSRPPAYEDSGRESIALGLCGWGALNMNTPGEGPLHMDSLSGAACICLMQERVHCTWIL